MVTLPGRERELEWLTERLRGSQDRGVAVLITGEAGVGKTRLVSEATAGSHVIARVTFPGARFASPGLGLNKLAHAGGRHARGLRAELASPPSSSEDSRTPMICAAANELLSTLAPGVVVLDDVQWADELTLAWLSEAVDVLDTSPVMLILVARATGRVPWRLSDSLAPLRRRRLLEAFELTPLGVDGVREMAASQGFAPTDEEIASLYQRSDGVPLLVEELLRADHGPELLRTKRSGPSAVPPVVAAIVTDTLARASPDARLLLLTAALSPQPLVESVLRDATGLSARAYDMALEEVLGTGLLRRGEAELHFRHELQREAVREETPLARKRRIHREIARTLRGFDPPRAGEIAQQLLDAGDTEEALEWLERAAEEALGLHDPGSALSFLDAAVRLGVAGTQLARVVSKATVAARSADRQEEGVRLIDTALGRRDLSAHDRGSVLLARSRLVLDRGDFAGRLEALDRARAAFVEARDEAGHAAVLGSMALPVDGLIPIPERIRLGRRGLELAERAGDPLVLARCAGNLAAAEMSEGHHRKAFALWARATDALSPASSPEVADEYLRNAGNLALASVSFGEYDQASKVIRDGLRIAADRHPRWEGKLRTTEALLLWRRGQWDLAVERGAHGHPVPATYTALVEGLASMVSFERDRRPDVAPLSEAAATLARHSDHAWAAAVQALLTRVRVLRREPRPGRGIMPLVEDLVVARMRTGWEDLLTASAEVDAGLYLRVRATLGPLRPAGPRADAATLLAEGLAGSDRQDETLIGAAEAFEALGEPYAAGLAWCHAAIARHRTGAAAGDLASRAAARLTEVGARRSLAHFLQRAPRFRTLDPYRGDRTVDGRWALSPREAEVAELARLGYTARQMAEKLALSVRTVEKHLEAVKAKLGASRKSELVRLLSEERTTRGGPEAGLLPAPR